MPRHKTYSDLLALNLCTTKNHNEMRLVMRRIFLYAIIILAVLGVFSIKSLAISSNFATFALEKRMSNSKQ